MVSLYLLPDRTRLVKGNLESSGKLKILAVDELPSYWDALVDPSEEVDADSGISRAAAALSGMFHEAAQIANASGEVFSLVLPDALFELVDCVREPEAEGGIDAYAAALLEMPAEEFSLSVPMETRPSVELCRTVFVLKKSMVQRLMDAAGEEGATLASVEPASVAFLRASGAYDREHFFFESLPDSAVVVAYSPIGGMFRIDAGILAEGRMLDMPEEAGNVDIRQILAELEAKANAKFRSASDDVPVVVLHGQRRKYAKFRALADRLGALAFAPDILALGIPDLGDPQDWMAPVGTLLADAGEDSHLYAKKPTFLSLGSANLLPEGMQTNAKLFRVTQRVKKTSRILCLAALFALAALAVPAFYFSSIEVPGALRARFESTQKELPVIEKELALLQKAKKEDCQPLSGFRAMLRPRPEELGFAKVRIGEAAGKEIWMEADIVTQNPLTFQDYVSSLSMDKKFRSASIVKIGTDASGWKTATVTFRKGETADEE